MPKKKVEEPTNKAEPAVVADDVEEDTAVIKALKKVDERYCAIEVEFERKAQELRKKFKDDNAHLLAERSKVLSDASSCPAEDKVFATPACRGFWIKAFQNCTEFAEHLEDHDEEVLEYLEDITTRDIDDVHEKRGTALNFTFKENPFFTNKALTVEIHYDYDPETFKPWQQLECREVKGCTIDWKAGKNVTVEMVQKKTKGGGAKKAKQKAKAKEEPRPSIFRKLFSSMKVGEPLPESIAFMVQGDGEDEGEDAEDKVKYLLMMVSEMCEVIDEGISKYAVRYYTGEAGDDDDDFSEDGEEESLDGDDDDSEDESEDEPPARAKGKGKAKAKAPKSGGAEGKEGQKAEECKQQ